MNGAEASGDALACSLDLASPPLLLSTPSSSSSLFLFPPLPLSLTNDDGQRKATPLPQKKTLRKNRPVRPLCKPLKRPSASPTSSASRTGSSPSLYRQRLWPFRSWLSLKEPCRCTRSQGRTLRWLFCFKVSVFRYRRRGSML